MFGINLKFNVFEQFQNSHISNNQNRVKSKCEKGKKTKYA